MASSRDEDLDQLEFRLSQILESSPLATFVLGPDHTITHWNSACAQITGLSAERMIGTRDAWRAFFAEPRPVLANLLLDGAGEEVIRSFYGVTARPSPGVVGGWEVVNRIDISDRWMSRTAAPILDLDGKVIGAVETLRDVTSDKYYEFELEYRTTHDSLTGLPNRTLLADRLDHAVRVAERNRRTVGVLHIGLDNFKLVNEGFGHPAGDQVLREAAQRLRACIRDGDTLARFSGDEFVILLADHANRETLSLLAQRCLDAITVPFHAQGHDNFLSASIGLALHPEDGRTASVLINAADTAMHLVKERRRGGYLFHESKTDGTGATERVAMRSALVKARERGEFAVHFQPKGRLSDGRVTGCEALLRWTHPVLGSVPPSLFIPILEETGQIVEIGEWVIERAVEQALAWRDRGMCIAVNLSARQLWQQLDLPERIQAVLDRHGAPAECLELELTESMLMQDPEQAVGTLNALAEMGVRLALDDFGTGYSSLAYLKRFPISTIKIDRSFVSDLTTDRDDLEIVRAIVTLAHSLDRRIVAEGVETEEQRRVLGELGCDEIQGYLLSRPLPPDELERFLAGGGRRLDPAG